MRLDCAREFLYFCGFPRRVSRNEASAKSLPRLGFRREGLLRERWIVGGEISDSALYGLLASEWRGAAP